MTSKTKASVPSPSSTCHATKSSPSGGVPSKQPKPHKSASSASKLSSSSSHVLQQLPSQGPSSSLSALVGCSSKSQDPIRCVCLDNTVSGHMLAR